MLSPKLTAIVTTLILIGGGHSAHAAYNLQQLQQIEQYVASKDCGGLLGYLESNPSIMAGSDSLAVELRNFANGVEGGLIQCLSAPPTRSGQTPATIAAY
ncbi:MAG: hypothetical protein ACSHXD_09895 [Marinosulfonomonas sp.]